MGSNRRTDPQTPSVPEATVSLDLLPLHSTNLLTVLDETGVIQYESPSIERIYGYRQDELVGEQVATYFYPNDREKVVETFQNVVNGEEDTTEAVEYRHKRADGTFLWVESIASANPTPDGQYVVNTRDISVQKEREQHLREANTRLEDFASTVSHDLRNPLNVAQGRLELARRECESENLAAVRDAHDRMELLIENVLAVARVGKEVPTLERVELAPLSEDCWQMVDTAEATLVIDTEQCVYADRDRLRQLVENLIRNAVEHGGEEVTVVVGARDGEFYVEDDGPGIPRDRQSQVFEAGHSTIQRGTGLGLSIVKQIVAAHDWHIHLTDGTHGGARFEITDVETD